MSADAHDSSTEKAEARSRVDLPKLQGDEAELARMGYKQELKFSRLPYSITVSH